ncbi:MAG: protein phosphatase 2C domain-containing protein [Lachnospiraceae bacterium]|nr:protein phosphatase 2C domain-containing protein [Lachnospiraceae bacterium]
MRIEGGCATDIGVARETNQDAILYRCVERDGQSFALGAVCDGVGGLDRGEIASGLVIEEIGRWFEEVAGWLDIAHAELPVMYSHIKDGVEGWNETLWNYMQHSGLHMGTTLSLFVILRNHYFLIQVGDSRIYRYRRGLELLTTDQSVARMKNGRLKNFLENYMGKNERLWFQSQEGLLEPGDMFLYCSDGLYHHLTDEDVKTALPDRGNASTLEWETGCSKLIRIMISRGEKDNISLGILRTLESAGKKGKRKKR